MVGGMTGSMVLFGTSSIDVVGVVGGVGVVVADKVKDTTDIYAPGCVCVCVWVWDRDRDRDRDR